MTTPAIKQRNVLERVLLETLATAPDGISTTDAYDSIGSQYEFPAEWYREIPKAAGHEVLAVAGYSDWRDVPQERLIELVKTEPQWQNELRWARNSLRKQRYLDEAAPRGLWRLTSAGMQAAGKISLAPLPPEVRKISQPRRRQSEFPQTSGQVKASSSKSLREALLDKLAALTHSMPVDDLDLLVDLARAVRSRSLGEGQSETGG